MHVRLVLSRCRTKKNGATDNKHEMDAEWIHIHFQLVCFAGHQCPSNRGDGSAFMQVHSQANFSLPNPQTLDHLRDAGGIPVE